MACKIDGGAVHHGKQARVDAYNFAAQLADDYQSPKGETPGPCGARGFQGSSLTMSYFHTGTRTIIGAEAFHCPVRDGKEWDHLAMVIRLNWLPTCAYL